MKERSGLPSQVYVQIFGVATAIAGVAYGLSPPEYKTWWFALSVWAGATVIIVIVLRFSALASWATQSVPAIWMALGLLILPISFLFLFDQSWRAALAGLFASVVILVAAHLTRERRQIVPQRIQDGGEGISWGGFGADQVGMGPSSTGPDGYPDAIFVLKLNSGFGTLQSLTVRRLKRTGEPTRQVWTTSPHNSHWPVGVTADDGRRLNPDRSRDLKLEVKHHVTLNLHISDYNLFPSGWFHPGQRYLVFIKFSDGSEQSFECVIP